MEMYTTYLLVLCLVNCYACGRQENKHETTRNQPRSPQNDYSERTRAPYCDFRPEVKWDRTDCGFPGSTKSWCESRGCCWDPVYKSGERWCFCPNKKQRWYYHDGLGRRRRNTGVHVETVVDKNCFCDGTEISKGGKGPRPFVVHCKKVTNKAIAECNRSGKNVCKVSRNNNLPIKQCFSGNSRYKREIKAETTCTYKGNPHRCPAYNKGGQVKFYKELLDEIAPRQCEQLNLENPDCPRKTFNTRKTCTGIDYNFQYKDKK